MNTNVEGTGMQETSKQADEVTKEVLVLAQEEARRFNHPYVGIEHLVLGMLSEAKGVAARAMNESGVTLDAFRDRVEAAVGRGSVPVSGDIETTPRTRSVVQGTESEAEERGHTTVDSGHLLLSLVHDGGGIASKLFRDLGVDIKELGSKAESMLDESRPS